MAYFRVNKKGSTSIVLDASTTAANYAVTLTTTHKSSLWILVCAYSGWHMGQASAKYGSESFTQLYYNPNGSNGNGVNQRMSVLVYKDEIPVGGKVVTSNFSSNGDNNSVTKVALFCAI